MEEKIEEKVVEKNLEQIPQHKQFLTRKIIIFSGLVILVLLFVGIGIFLSHKNQPAKTVATPLKRSELSGHIIYADKTGWEEMDVKTGKITPLFKSFGYDWVYKNGYIFTSSTSSVLRYSIKTKQTDTVPVESLGAPQINPSPDGEKVYVYNAPGYPGDPTPPEVFLYNFTTQQKIQFPSGRWGLSWMSDSRHMITNSVSSMSAATVYDGSYTSPIKLFIWDIHTDTSTQIAEGTIRNMATTRKDIAVSWLVYNGEHFPSFYTTSVNPATNTIGKILKFSGLNMPIPKDYFRSVSWGLYGGGPNEFYLTVDNKNLSVYFTNSQNIFQKISPDNDFSYTAVAYNSQFDKVLAFKFPKKMFPVNIPPSQVRSYKYKPYLVLLDKKGAYEKVITKLEGFLPYSASAFSPDGKYLISPKYSDQFNNSEYTIFSVENPERTLVLKENLGNKFYWVK